MNKTVALIENLEEELRQAMLSSDVETLDKLIADSLAFTSPTGDVIDKQTDLNVHRSGIQKLYKLIPSEQKVYCYENVATVTVKMQIEGEYENNPISGKFCYTRVWAKFKDDWKVIAGHVSALP